MFDGGQERVRYAHLEPVTLPQAVRHRPNERATWPAGHPNLVWHRAGPNVLTENRRSPRMPVWNARNRPRDIGTPGAA